MTNEFGEALDELKLALYAAEELLVEQKWAVNVEVKLFEGVFLCFGRVSNNKWGLYVKDGSTDKTPIADSPKEIRIAAAFAIEYLQDCLRAKQSSELARVREATERLRRFIEASSTDDHPD